MKAVLNSAAYRIAFISWLAFALAMLVLGAAVFYAAHSAFERQLDENIAQATAGIMGELRDDGMQGLLVEVRERERRNRDRLGYAVFDAGGKRVGGHLVTAMPPPGWHWISFLDPREGPDPARAEVTMLSGGHRLVVAADLGPLERIDNTILIMFGIAFLALLVIGVFGALLLGAYLRRRLARIEATAGAIVAGDLSRRMDIGPRDDEFDRVAASLNAMLDRIAGLIANLRQVTSDLAHDLRTPLARLRNRLEGLRERSGDPDLRDFTDSAVEQADEVLQLFDAILRISELEEGSLKRRFALVDLGALVEEVGEMHQALAEDSGRTLLVEAGRDCAVKGDRELIAQALINLIENALRHTPADTAIRLGARREGDCAVAYVRDDGPGIPAAERERVFERFVRLESSRSAPGHGLGLSLVKAIAAIHDAEIRIGDARPGLEIALRFPAAGET